MYQAMLMDKKVQSKKLRYILLRSLGEAFIDDNVTEENVLGVISNRMA